ncbi:hypothetical protein CGRA01v4_04868 [Colletotrichum graminicola]|nr:hypothetical protein CGRA01v4_04868 [Colletotrichum graminicola]
MGKSRSGLFCLYLHRSSPRLDPPLPPDGLSRHARASGFLYRFCSCTSFGSAFTLLVIVGVVAIPSIHRQHRDFTRHFACLTSHSLAFLSVLACRFLVTVWFLPIQCTYSP